MGLAPYIFTSSSHISFTLTLVMPVIVIIETVRNVIRPGTLSIRLAANIVAGHLLLTLLGSQGPNVAG